MVNRNFKMCRKCIYNRRTYTMQTTGNFISATAEFSAGMQDRKHDFYRRNTCFVVDSDRNASSIVNDCYGIIFIYRYLDGITIPRKSFINCIIYNLINQMMKTSGRCTADIHTRSLSYSLKTFQYLNLICTVFCIALCAHSNLLSFLFILRKQHRLQHEKLCSTETCFL